MKLSPFFWLAGPLFITSSYLALLFFVPWDTVDGYLQESGPYEWLQFFLIGMAFFVAVSAMRQPGFGRDPLMKTWIILAAICCFYVAGEEVSWGQHIFGWETPDAWAEINDHDETNLHNVTKWIDQKPKALLEYGIIFGGMLVPLATRYRPNLLPGRFDNFYPSALLAVTAGCLAFFRFGKEICDLLQICQFIRISEIKETLMYYFVLFYLWELRGRLA